MTYEGQASAPARDRRPPPRGSVDIRRLLHWAIGHQKAHRYADTVGDVLESGWVAGGRGVDSIAICQNNNELGGRIDSSPGSWKPEPSVDDDALVAFRQVQATLRDWRAYRLVVDHAEAGDEPDWHPGARPRAVPESTYPTGKARPSSHDVVLASLTWHRRVRVRGEMTEQHHVGVHPAGAGWQRMRSEFVTVRSVAFTPVAWLDEPGLVVLARRVYRQWWDALAAVAGALRHDAGGPHGLQRWSDVTLGIVREPWPAEEQRALERMAVEIDLARRDQVEASRRAVAFDTSGVKI